MSAYREFAALYDELMDDIPYDEWAKRYERLIGLYPGMRVAEMGCGTGAFSVRLARDGAKLVATDLSQEMIERAQVRAREAGAGVQFAVMDMERFALPRKVEAVFCACDGVNYLTSPDKVRRCFARVFESLKPGGRFAFDISGPAKLKGMAGQMYGEDRENVTYVWMNHWQGDPSRRLLKMALTFFVRQENGLYRRFDEEHVQRAHEAEELVGALRQAGFENIETFSGLTDQPARPDDARIHFRAVKPDGREK